MEALNILTWVSRGSTIYNYTQARNLNDVISITIRFAIAECLLYQAKKNIARNQYIHR